MKKLNIWTYAVFFTGNFLGAGFVSGNELFQFFGGFGVGGVIGMGLSFVGFCLIGILTVRYAAVGGVSEIDRLIIPGRHPALLALIGFVQTFLMFSVFAIMTAGAGALLTSLAGLPTALGCCLFCAVIAAIELCGLRGVVTVFAASVPLLALTVTALALLTLPAWVGAGAPLPAGGGQNPLLPNWGIAAITYIAFNLGGCVGVLAAAAGQAGHRRTVYLGTALGTLFLAVIAGSIFMLLGAYPAFVSQELPMLATAREVSGTLGVLYGVLLLCAMAGTSLSACFGTAHFLRKKWSFAARAPRVTVLFLCAVAFVCSLVGFGELVGTVYPIFGYASILLIILLVVNALRFFRAKSRDAGNRDKAK